jgi:hypothetical protein
VSRLFRVRNRIRNARFGFGQSGEAGNITPLTIFDSDLVLWFNAKQSIFSDAGSTPVVDTGTVQQWNDLSGNGYHLSEAINKPVYDVDGLNGLPALIGAHNNYMNTGDVVAFGGATAVSMFIVGTMAAYGGGGVGFDRLISCAPTAGDSDFNTTSGFNFCRESTNNAVMTAYFNNAADGEVAISLDTPYRFAATIDGDTTITYVDNVAGDTVPDAGDDLNLGTCDFRIFRYPTTETQQFWDGTVSEVVIVKRLATALERAALDNYFVSEWAFS